MSARKQAYLLYGMGILGLPVDRIMLSRLCTIFPNTWERESYSVYTRLDTLRLVTRGAAALLPFSDLPVDFLRWLQS